VPQAAREAQAGIVRAALRPGRASRGRDQALRAECGVSATDREHAAGRIYSRNRTFRHYPAAAGRKFHE